MLGADPDLCDFGVGKSSEVGGGGGEVEETRVVGAEGGPGGGTGEETEVGEGEDREGYDSG